MRSRFDYNVIKISACLSINISDCFSISSSSFLLFSNVLFTIWLAFEWKTVSNAVWLAPSPSSSISIRVHSEDSGNKMYARQINLNEQMSLSFVFHKVECSPISIRPIVVGLCRYHRGMENKLKIPQKATTTTTKIPIGAWETSSRTTRCKNFGIIAVAATATSITM